MGLSVDLLQSFGSLVFVCRLNFEDFFTKAKIFDGYTLTQYILDRQADILSKFGRPCNQSYLPIQIATD